MKNLKKILSIIAIIILISVIVFVVINKNNKSNAKESNILENTSWYATDNSNVIFEDGIITWYREADSESYYKGKYKTYVGEDAYNYLTKDLKEYGVTKGELNDLFKRNNLYSKDKLIVVDIYYDKFMLDGMEQKVSNPHVPWFGFILEDNTLLDVANMNTESYYRFEKAK